MHNSFEPIIVVTREEVESQDLSNIVETLNALIGSTGAARLFFERVDIAFDGYNETSEELFEILEVRNFVHALDDKFPYWLFFLTKSGFGLQCITYCFLPPFLTSAAKAEHFPRLINDLLTKRWFPAMNHICEWAGFKESEIEVLIERLVDYLLGGPFEA